MLLKTHHTFLLIRYFLCLGGFVVLSANLSAQLVTQGGIAPLNLVQNFLVGGGVQVSNVSVSGSPQAYGYFTAYNTSFAIQEGIIMTTGTISGANGPQGPNSGPNAEGEGVDNNYPGSALLDNAFNFTEPTFNATTLQFNFVPQGDSVVFKYIFGSDEYKEYVGSAFNDIFGFFISGPNPAGGTYNNQNIARLPNGTLVSINNVNHLSNSAYYQDNPPNGSGPLQPYFQYDGLTRVLTARASVVPCSTYTIRLAIADVADGIYDSGVFLEAKSFSSAGLDIQYTLINSPKKDSLFEGCGQAQIVIKTTAKQATDRVLQLSLMGSAVNGTDYQNLPTSVTIPAGQDSVVLLTSALVDGQAEGLENLIVEVNDPNLCPNTPRPSIEIPIVSVDPMQLTAMNDTSFECNNQLVILQAQAQGGVAPLSLTWNPGGLVGSPVPALVGQTTNYVVEARDACQNVARDTVRIQVPDAEPVELTFVNDTAVCPGDAVLLSVTAGGGIGNLELSWSNGAPDSIFQQWVYPQETTVYSVTVTDSCGNTRGASALVTVRDPQADFSYSYADNRKLVFEGIGSDDVIGWYWDFGDGNVDSVQSPIHTYRDSGFYEVSLIVSNSFGCTDTIIKTIYAYPDFGFYIPNTFTPNNDGINDIFDGKGQGFKAYEMYIFNRWGQELYSSMQYGRGWSGLDQGERYPIGVYAYRFVLTLPNGRTKEFLGHVNLLR